MALSRCKTLEGMVLESPLRREAIISEMCIRDSIQAYVFTMLSAVFIGLAQEGAKVKAEEN